MFKLCLYFKTLDLTKTKVLAKPGSRKFCDSDLLYDLESRCICDEIYRIDPYIKGRTMIQVYTPFIVMP